MTVRHRFTIFDVKKITARAPFHQHGVTDVGALINNHILVLWRAITRLWPKSNSFEVRAWINRPVSQIRVPPAACREPAGSYSRLLEVLYVFEHKTQYFYSMLHIPALRYFDISVTCPHRFHRVKLVIIPPCLYSNNICEILLYNHQLVVITF